MIAERFAANLAAARSLAGLSQEDLGVRAGLHRTEISQLERGLRLARLDTFVKLLGALDATPDELLEGITWHPGERRTGHFL